MTERRSPDEPEEKTMSEAQAELADSAETTAPVAGEERDEALQKDAVEPEQEASEAVASVDASVETETTDAEPRAEAGDEARVDDPAAHSADQPAETVAPQPVKPRGRLLGALALLLALTAAAGVGYLYYELVYLAPLNAVSERSAELDAKYADLESKLSQRMEEISATSSQAVSELAQSQAARLAENEAAVVKSLNDALLAAPPSQREWKLAEAEYLMRIANHRVLMEQDSDGALNLLMAADRILTELDDFALHQVRARLADEIIALEQVRRDDLQGIYLRLEALKGQLQDLPLATPEYLESEPDESQAELTVWQTMAEELKQFVRIRQMGEGEAIKPLLAPEEERYLELNLRLAVEQAQLAALRRQQVVFEQSLTSLRDWYAGYMDPNDERTQAVLDAVDELLQLELARPLPDVSGSLNELLSAIGGGS